MDIAGTPSEMDSNSITENPQPENTNETIKSTENDNGDSNKTNKDLEVISSKTGDVTDGDTNVNEEVNSNENESSNKKIETSVQPTDENININKNSEVTNVVNSDETSASEIKQLCDTPSNKKDESMDSFEPSVESPVSVGTSESRNNEGNLSIPLENNVESNKSLPSVEEEMDVDKEESSKQIEDVEMADISETDSENKTKEQSNNDDTDKEMAVTDEIDQKDIQSEEEEKEKAIGENDALSDVDDSDAQQENPVFVHVTTKDDGDKTVNSDVDQNEIGEENLETEDPIGIQGEKDIIEFSEDKDIETITSDKSGEDEDVCIIPDTEREITQEEKDAAVAAVAEKRDEASAESTSASKEKDKGDKGKTNEEENKRMETDSISVSTSTTTKESSEQTQNEDAANILNTNHEATDPTKSSVIQIEGIQENEQFEVQCHQCCNVKMNRYRVENQTEPTYLCSQSCLLSFHALNKRIPESSPLESSIRLKDITNTVPTPEAPTSGPPHRKCSECFSRINELDEKILCWETMDFCNEDCLGKYQNKIGAHCANCKNDVQSISMGKYCVRFGHDIRQFCCSSCLEEFKKGLKVCSYCQKDISGGPQGFLAPVGDQGKFKDFCTQLCMDKYDQMSNKNSANKAPPETAVCTVCKKESEVNIKFEQRKFCSEPCFIAFKFVNSVVEPMQCEMCKSYFDKPQSADFSIYCDNIMKRFCSKTCQNIYIIANRRIVPCSWCKVKKYNFDMIRKVCGNGQILMMCSLNCLGLFQVSVNAVFTKRIQCDHCGKITQAQYHLTMSDATIRNFCGYPCVMAFQNQFSKVPITLANSGTVTTPPESNSDTRANAVPTGRPKRYAARVAAQQIEAAGTNKISPLPVITNVHSLALPAANGTDTEEELDNNLCNSVGIADGSPGITQYKQIVVVKEPKKKEMKNSMTMCKPVMHTKAISCRPHPCSREMQTDEIKEKTALIPVPTPIYVPVPVQMYSAPVPVPIPFPIPIPVPIFIPTTRNSAAGIMKEIKKIQVKIPTDPFEAELLMMAEMVAGEKKVDNTDSESEDDDAGDGGHDGSFSPEAVDTSNAFGDDMLQIALKMATEMDEPAVDLEGALTANTITAQQNQDQTGVVQTEETVDDPQSMHQLIDRGAVMRGRKRANRIPRVSTTKRRRISQHVEIPMMPPPPPQPPAEPVEKPDANMCLKYTFGVNAWKQWVTTKNAELEKSSRRVKLFKNEILQLTADELNYSLCLFVKEVRKPNGTEYAPDTIYYLCLGIQQYLFENGRIDNIFTDAYYEKFTDCLDEVARKFSVLYNDSHYIVTRVEEEHLWESKQLGAHSPHVLLSTLMFFNTKHFNLTTVDEHMQLSFSHIMKHWKRNPNQPGAAKIPGSRNVLLRFYPPQSTIEANARKKKVYEQQENEENPLRCPVKLYEFYLSKCPESVKTRNDVFYLLPERSCVPDSPVWYSTMALGREALEKMLHRVKMVKEINVALLTME